MSNSISRPRKSKKKEYEHSIAYYSSKDLLKAISVFITLVIIAAIFLLTYALFVAWSYENIRAQKDQTWYVPVPVDYPPDVYR